MTSGLLQLGPHGSGLSLLGPKLGWVNTGELRGNLFHGKTIQLRSPLDSVKYLLEPGQLVGDHDRTWPKIGEDRVTEVMAWCQRAMDNTKKKNRRAESEPQWGRGAKRLKLTYLIRHRAATEPLPKTKAEFVTATANDASKTKQRAKPQRGEKPVKAMPPEATAPINNVLDIISTKRVEAVELGGLSDDDHSTPSSHTADDDNEVIWIKTQPCPRIPTAEGSLVSTERGDRKHGGFPFLFLPPELRLVIYAHLFNFDQPVFPDKTAYRYYYDPIIEPRSHTNVAFAMMCVNKQLAEEVAHFVYTQNRFFLPGSSSFSFTSIGRRNSNLLQHIIIDCAGLPERVALQLSGVMSNAIWSPDFENLRKLTFYDRWKVLETSILPRTLLAIGSAQRWKMFPNLHSMHFDLGATTFTLQEQAHFERLCLQSRANITVGPERLGGLMDGNSSQPGEVTLTLTPAEMDIKLALHREEKKKRLAARREQQRRASELKQEEERKAQLEEKPKVPSEEKPKVPSEEKAEA
ncbi:predicted protein [Chaetomium globosum CBS 148.51]|uniref:Uncharacterized protein n=1 Tax=Chaetomium globosum (strain ATCC 6205 / CBS 148.51 / DSM 1962 / NBRC 6347 / NRRL 1970) TaxID=306901 RepID=Q2GRB1_CHAGB|nr:uncharacterized protein CHGG_09493 [Chaetomium globosum CBS 148.51]EAQ85479.1 predicted protein [Chaetomium globosum CBS 148.51]